MMRKPRLNHVDLQILLALDQAPAKIDWLARALGLNPWAVRRRMEKLRRYGFIHWQPYKPITLSPEGREELEKRLPKAVEPVDIGLGQVLDALPSDLHRAILRLTLDVVVAKAHLRHRYREGWPAIIVCGPTKTLKSSVGRLVARVLGLDPARIEHLCYPGRIAPGDPGIRRYQAEGGVWRVAASPDFRRPLVILDELDKAVGDAALRYSLFAFLDDRAVITVEGQAVEIACVPYVTANWPREKLLGSKTLAPYLRRGFVGDTAFVAASWPPGFAEKTGAKLASLRVPQLDIGHLVPPDLPSGVQDLVAKILAKYVTPEGRDLWDVLPILHAIRGRAALVGDPMEAVFEVLHDRLLLLASLGVTVPGWAEALGERWARYRSERSPEVRRRVLEAKRAREEIERSVEAHRARVHEERLARVRERLAFVEAREELKARLSQARQTLARYRLEPGLRASLGELARAVAKARTQEALRELRELAEGLMAQAQEAVEAYRARKAEEERRKRELKERREKIKRQLAAVRQALKKGGNISPKVLAAKLVALGLFKPVELTWKESPQVGPGGAILALGATVLGALLKAPASDLVRPIAQKVTGFLDPWGRIWLLPGDPKPPGGVNVAGREVRDIREVPSSWADPEVRLMLGRLRETLENQLSEAASAAALALAGSHKG